SATGDDASRPRRVEARRAILRGVGAFTRKDAVVRTQRLFPPLAGLVAAIVGGLFRGGSSPRLLSHHLSLPPFPPLYYWPLILLLGVAQGYAVYFRLRHFLESKWLERCGRLHVDERGLWLDDALVVSRSLLCRGDVLRRGGVAYIRIEVAERGSVEVVVKDEE